VWRLEDRFCRRIRGPSFFLQNWVIVHGRVCEVAGNHSVGGTLGRAKGVGVLSLGVGSWALVVGDGWGWESGVAGGSSAMGVAAGVGGGALFACHFGNHALDASDHSQKEFVVGQLVTKRVRELERASNRSRDAADVMSLLSQYLRSFCVTGRLRSSSSRCETRRYWRVTQAEVASIWLAWNGGDHPRSESHSDEDAAGPKEDSRGASRIGGCPRQRSRQDPTGDRMIDRRAGTQPNPRTRTTYNRSTWPPRAAGRPGDLVGRVARPFVLLGKHALVLVLCTPRSLTQLLCISPRSLGGGMGRRTRRRDDPRRGQAVAGPAGRGRHAGLGPRGQRQCGEVLRFEIRLGKVLDQTPITASHPETLSGRRPSAYLHQHHVHAQRLNRPALDVIS
jgi:hypothetical protein